MSSNLHHNTVAILEAKTRRTKIFFCEKFSNVHTLTVQLSKQQKDYYIYIIYEADRETRYKLEAIQCSSIAV